MVFMQNTIAGLGQIRIDTDVMHMVDVEYVMRMEK